MKDLKQLFDFLNDVSFEYVVLRNWDNLPYSVELGDHSDLDLLVYDLEHFKEIIPEAKAEFPDYPTRVRYKLPIGNEYIFMDVRFLGDGYYPSEFEKAILDTRVFNENGFYTPNPIHHRLALAYHVVHHKNSNTYERWLGKASVKELLESLKKTPIGWVAPSDLSVGKFNAYWSGATSTVSNEGGKILKKQNSFMSYNLIDNEKRILSKVDCVHFPKILGEEEGSIVLEDCGEPLTSDNLPEDWKSQLVSILMHLRENKIIHRDIKPDNLMIKDGVIKLIDFGWAKLEGEEDNPPSCLGYPFKPSYGFDDNFSMRAVIKKLEFELEEKREEIFK